MTTWLDVLRAALPPSGVLLVGAGAGDGQWVQWLKSRDVASLGVPVHLLEGDEQRYRHLEQSLPPGANWILRRDVVAASSGKATFHRASNPAESGLLKPESLRDLWPHLGTEETIVIEDAVTLDALREEAASPINWLVLDCLPAAGLLQGATQLLSQLDVVLVRVLTADVGLPIELLAGEQAADELLRAAGLRRIHAHAERHPALGHAVYVRDSVQVQERARNLGEQLAVVQEAWEKEKAELARVKEQKEERDKVASKRKKQIEQLEADKSALEKANAELEDLLAQSQRRHDQVRDLLEQHRRELAQSKEEKEERDNVVLRRKLTRVLQRKLTRLGRAEVWPRVSRFSWSCGPSACELSCS